jgi:hypothetical protein
MKFIHTIMLALMVNAGATAQDKEGSKDPQGLGRIPNYVINDQAEYKAAFDIMINFDGDNKTTVTGKLTDYDYLNFDSKTFVSTDAMVKHYAELLTGMNATEVYKGESISCMSEVGYMSSGNGAIYKMSKGGKDAWCIVITINEGNYKVLFIEAE